MSGLNEIQECWRQTFGEMRRRHPDILTGPHITVAPDGYDPGCIPSVLYVGQAPGRNEPQLEDPLPSVREFRRKTKSYLANEIIPKEQRNTFWGFGKRLSRDLACSTGYPEAGDLRNLIWSNICKVGVCEGNPEGKYRDVFLEQQQLAADTLKAEIAEYRPRLVLFATGDQFGWEVVRDVADDADDSTWDKTNAEKGVYQRCATRSQPAMLWTPHPARKKSSDWDLWIELACKLIAV